jgi:hypothetical protein
MIDTCKLKVSMRYLESSCPCIEDSQAREVGQRPGKHQMEEALAGKIRITVAV